MRSLKMLGRAAAVLLPFVAGCTSIELPRIELRPLELPFSLGEEKLPPGRVAVVAGAQAPVVTVSLPSQDDSARRMAAAKKGAQGGVALACGPVVAIPIAVVPLGILCVVGVAPLAAAGALVRTLDVVQQRPEPRSQALPPSEYLASLVARELNLDAAPGEADTLLEISLRRISGESAGDPDIVVLTVEAGARWLRAADRRVLRERAYSEKMEVVMPRGEEREREVLTAALRAAYVTLARAIAPASLN